MFLDKLIPSIAIAVTSTFATYTDAARTQQQVNFAPNQTVYLQVSDLPGDIYLLDDDKNRLFRIENKQFQAPASSGVYYIDAKLNDGNGKSFAGQRNINVAGSLPVTSSPVISETETSPTVTSMPVVSLPVISVTVTSESEVSEPVIPVWRRVLASIFKLFGLDL